MRSGADSGETGNLIGPVGAQVAAAGYGVLGLAVVAVALAVLVLGYRLVRARAGFPSLLQGAGIVVALLALPTLLDLAVGELQVRGEPLVAGGPVGSTISGGIQSQLGFIGAAVIAVLGLVFGVALTMRGRVAGRRPGPAEGTRRSLQGETEAWPEGRQNE